ncbi:MAG TPA: glycosyltransferase family 39 protein [Patescibacteria group bacterium]|nr:glycosyltransferase family 39 protein [Patescibacteria group bacterium]
MLKFIKKYKAFIALGSFILLLGFTLRLFKLTSLPVFADEAIYVRWAQVMRAEETLRFLPLSDGKQPLFMWVVIPFLKIFTDPLFAGRFVSVLCGAGTIVGVFLTSKLLFKSNKAAIIASLVIAVSPFAVFFDKMALVDSMLAMFGIWTFFLAALTATRLKLDTAILTGFALGAALLTKSPALFFALLIPFMILLINWPKNPKARVFTFGKFVFFTVVSIFIGYAIFNILRLGPNFHLLSSRNLDYVYPFTHIFENPLDPFLSLVRATFVYFKLLGPWTLMPLVVLGAIFSFKADWRKSLVVLLWFIVPILGITEYAKVYTARYILFPLPYLAIFAGNILPTGKKSLYWAGMILLALFLSQSLMVNRRLLFDIQKAQLPRSERSGYLEDWTAGFGIKEVSELVRAEFAREPGKKIVIGTEGYFGTLPDGLQMYLNDMPQIIVVGVGLGIDKIPTPLAESRAYGNKTYLVVNSTRLLEDADKLGLRLINSYPKATKPEGRREDLLFFEVTK